MRFRRRAKLFPGVYLNFSKSGISTTIGVPGASININKQGTFLNTGIPGTGIYNRQKIGGERTGNQSSPKIDTEPILEKYLNEEEGAIKTEKAEATTTEGLQELRKTLLGCYQERTDLNKEIIIAKNKLTFATIILIFVYVLIFGFFVKWFKENRKTKKEYVEDLKKQLEDCFVNIDMEVDEQFENKYNNLLHNYDTLLSCVKIWDITSSVSIDQKRTRSAASTAVTRRVVKFGFGNIDIIRSKYNALHFENANGGDLYIYPAFLAIVDSHKKFGLVDIRELDFNFDSQRFVEDENVPKDAEVIDYTWAKVNKNGSRDKRFKDNYQIPICKYGEISLTSKTGLNEAYSVSNYNKSLKFAQAMVDYQKNIK
ncbi:MAG: DUF4236 domain-containing protein [Marinifilaceae bacterium]